MAGHSKWAQIKRKKGALDVKKGATLAKMAKIIMVTVRTGGGADPKHNFQLRTAIDKAKEAGVPKINIERAIEKAAGESAENAMREMIYEGYLPGGIAVMVFTATDNNNRTVADLRAIFGKAGGELGSQGCVSYMFSKRGEIVINGEVNEDELMADAIDAGANDIWSLQNEGEDETIVITEPDDLEAISTKLSTKYKIQESAISRVALTTIELDGDSATKIMKTLETIDDHDDVIDIVSNFDIQI
jgi:YebC/PmpR family DNA-binding regulatory protein